MLHAASGLSLIQTLLLFAKPKGVHSICSSKCTTLESMEQLTDYLAKIELVADEIIDTKQQIVNLDARRHKNREALNRHRDSAAATPGSRAAKNWICIGDMFIKVNNHETRNIILEDQYNIDEGVEKLREDLKQKVEKLQQLEGKPEIRGLRLKPLDKNEISALRTGFKL